MVVKACDECKALNTKRKLYHISKVSYKGPRPVHLNGVGDCVVEGAIPSGGQLIFKIVGDDDQGIQPQGPSNTLCRECLNTEIERLLDAEGK